MFSAKDVLLGWAAALLHVVSVGRFLRARAPMRKKFTGVGSILCGSVISGLTAVGACTIPLAVRTSRAPVCGDGGAALTISRIVSESPWSAATAVGLVLIAAGVRAALYGAGAPRCAAVLGFSILLVAGAPDIGGGVSWAHFTGIALGAVASSAAFFTDAIELSWAMRCHAVFAVPFAVLATWTSLHPPEGLLRLAGVVSEAAAMLHFVAIFV